MTVPLFLVFLVVGATGIAIGWWLRGSCQLATKRDVRDAKLEIIKAFGDRVDPEAQRKIDAIYSRVTAGKAKVQNAIDENK